MFISKKIPYFIFKYTDEKYYLIHSNCPHRGGPLHLGCLSNENQMTYLSCPWHKNKFKLEHLLKKAFFLKKINQFEVVLTLARDKYEMNEIFLTKKIINLTNDEVNISCQI